ncbi:MAG: dihydrolipoamide dehydrogenase, partial [Candidatus Omnitrophota bacterium]
VTKLTAGTAQLTKKRDIKYVQGRGTFVDSNTLSIAKKDGTTETLTFEKCILATGSRPVAINAWPKSERIIDSTEALELKSIPKNMLIVGGGVIGLELGSVYADLGTNIDVVEMLPHLINGADRDIIRVLEATLKKSFEEIMLETKVTTMVEEKSGIKVSFEDKTGKVFNRTYEKVFVAIGRRPNSENIGLENTKVTLTDRGFVNANDQLLTSDPSIYAIGDLIGQPMLAHKASHEGVTAAGAIAGHKVAFEPKCIPSVVYTDPEVAWCGLTEIEAKEKNIEVSVQKFPWGASGRAIAITRTDGLTKLIFDPKTETLLGMAIAGVGAGELIAEGVLAIEMGATATDMKMTIHPHPTISETIMESAESFFGMATHIYKPKKK